MGGRGLAAPSYPIALRLLCKAFLERFFHFLGAEFPENADAAVVDVHHMVSLPVKVPYPFSCRIALSGYDGTQQLRHLLRRLPEVPFDPCVQKPV